jgi:uncharacterized membrane protein YjfL (UPF0719 family)
MNEIFDKLIIRFVFSFFICLVLYLYKYAHYIFYPQARKQFQSVFTPSTNTANSIHYFGRLIGIALIFSNLGFNETAGVMLSLINFLFWSFITISLYLASLYITESIFLYNFNYLDEVLKKKNISYSIITFANAICVSLLIKQVVLESEFSVILLLMFWLLAMVLYGVVGKLFRFISPLSLNKLIIQKNLAIAISYSGFLFGATTLIMAAFEQNHIDVKRYGVQVLLSIILSLLIYPIFILGFRKAFNIQDDLMLKSHENEVPLPEIGYGVYEAAMYQAAGLLTSIIVGHVELGIIYPFF